MPRTKLKSVIKAAVAIAPEGGIVKRKRGRPKKVVPSGPEVDSVQGPPKVKAKRGRKPKIHSPSKNVAKANKTSFDALIRNEIKDVVEAELGNIANNITGVIQNALAKVIKEEIKTAFQKQSTTIAKKKRGRKRKVIQQEEVQDEEEAEAEMEEEEEEEEAEMEEEEGDEEEEQDKAPGSPLYKGADEVSCYIEMHLL